MKTKKIYGLMVLFITLSLTVLLTGCGKQPVTNNTSLTNQEQKVNVQPPVQETFDVMITSNPTLGQILVDGKGMTLYTYTKDTKDNSTCYEACAVNWPPLLTTDTPKIVSALVNDNFGVITRTNGDKQITYKGMPLYHWIKDTKSGDATGENVGGVWFTHQITEEDLAK